MVVKQVKQWLQTRASAARWRPFHEWAEAQQGVFRPDEEGGGFRIDLQRQGRAFRIEWGESQRDYIAGHEMRLRFEAGLHHEVQTMVLDRKLMESLEAAVFEAYTDTLKTRVDTGTPEEMRWLVMFGKCAPTRHPELLEQMGFIGVHRDMAAAWVDGLLGDALSGLAGSVLRPGRPFVLMCMRGNVYLRVAMDEPDAAEMQQLMHLTEAAAVQAQPLSERVSELGHWPSTTTASFLPTQSG